MQGAPIDERQQEASDSPQAGSFFMSRWARGPACFPPALRVPGLPGAGRPVPGRSQCGPPTQKICRIPARENRKITANFLSPSCKTPADLVKYS